MALLPCCCRPQDALAGSCAAGGRPYFRLAQSSAVVARARVGEPSSVLFYPAKKGYCLFGRRVAGGKTAVRSSGGTASLWETWIPVRVNAMVKAGDVIFTAGVPDVLDKDDPMASFEGRKGSILQAVSAKDGAKLSEYKFNSLPVFDGLIAANEKLFMSTTNGSVICYR